MLIDPFARGESVTMGIGAPSFMSLWMSARARSLSPLKARSSN
jgi:hypothetical protein